MKSEKILLSKQKNRRINRINNIIQIEINIINRNNHFFTMQNNNKSNIKKSSNRTKDHQMQNSEI